MCSGHYYTHVFWPLLHSRVLAITSLTGPFADGGFGGTSKYRSKIILLWIEVRMYFNPHGFAILEYAAILLIFKESLVCCQHVE